ncbi:Rec8 like protein-domain-containing protein [Cladochytrium replicatum]|nr:Rec8 like protein-domain-containing protein [Cladochytrium replicatum]
MFFSQDLQLKRGDQSLSIFWLAGTLGLRSYGKKLTKSQLLAVNIVKACKSIVAPKTPHALRLSACLLVGATKIFSEQCTFCHAEVQQVLNQLRRANTDLTMPSASARFEQITLAIVEDLDLLAMGIPKSLDIVQDWNDSFSQSRSAVSATSGGGLLFAGTVSDSGSHSLVPEDLAASIAGSVTGFPLAGGQSNLNTSRASAQRGILASAQEITLPDPHIHDTFNTFAIDHDFGADSFVDLGIGGYDEVNRPSSSGERSSKRRRLTLMDGKAQDLSKIQPPINFADVSISSIENPANMGSNSLISFELPMDSGIEPPEGKDYAAANAAEEMFGPASRLTDDIGGTGVADQTMLDSQVDALAAPRRTRRTRIRKLVDEAIEMSNNELANNVANPEHALLGSEIELRIKANVAVDRMRPCVELPKGLSSLWISAMGRHGAEEIDNRLFKRRRLIDTSGLNSMSQSDDIEFGYHGGFEIESGFNLDQFPNENENFRPSSGRKGSTRESLFSRSFKSLGFGGGPPSSSGGATFRTGGSLRRTPSLRGQICGELERVETQKSMRRSRIIYFDHGMLGREEIVPDDDGYMRFGSFRQEDKIDEEHQSLTANESVVVSTNLFWSEIQEVAAKAETDHVYFDDFVKHRSRTDAARRFYAVLAIASKHYIKPRQETAYGDIVLHFRH